MIRSRFLPLAAIAALSVVAYSQTKTTPGTPRVVKPEDLKALSWRSIGPANMGGRVADICLAPGNGKSFFVAYGIGGLWKTTNRGNTLSPVFDHEITNSIGSVVVADAPATWAGWKDSKDKPEDLAKKGKAKIVWVGSGEGNGRNSSSWGHGVYRSTDGGSSFTNVGLEESHDIPRLAVDPRNPDICYAAAMGHLWGPNKMRGLYKTEDGGKTWKPVLQIDQDTGAIDVILDPSNPDTVYAGMYMRRRTPYSFVSGGKEGGVYKSTDAGKTWAKLTNGLPKQSGRIGLDLYRKNPNIVYAVVESDVGGGSNIDDERSRSGGLFRSDDAGKTWTRIHGRVPRAFYFAKVRVDPEDDQRVYLIGYGVDISDDGGHAFRRGFEKTHGDFHALVIDPDDHEHLLAGDDGGLFQSFDRGETWDYLNVVPVGQFYNIALDHAEPYHVFGGLQDNGSWMGPSATHYEYGSGAAITNADWKMVTDSDGFHCAFDPQDENILYSEGQGGGLVRTNLVTHRQRDIAPVPKEGQAAFRFNWNTPFFCSAHEVQTLYMGGNCVFKLTERGDNWQTISPDLSRQEIAKDVTTGSNAETYGTVVALSESPLQQGLLWAGTDDGLIHVTADDGATWRDVTPPIVGGHYVAKIKASAHDKNVAYAAIDMHRDDNMDPLVIMTRDEGKTWQNITGDLPKGWSTKSICEDLKNPDVLYCGTQNALYFTYDQGKHWLKINGSSLPTVPVEDIVEHPRDFDIVLATHGRSIWVIDDGSPFSQTTTKVIDSPLHLFDIQPSKPRYRLGGWLIAHHLFRASNPPSGVRINYWVRDYTGDDVSVEITDSKDHKVRTLTGSGKPGYNRVIWDLLPEENMRVPGNNEQPGEPLYVPAGEYKVTVSMGKEKMTKTVKVETGT